VIDLYEVLQVDRGAEPEVIRAAYRALARRNHPDFGGDARRMATINEAWNVLGDPS
jgi:curved DNA-binding protein CbpA